MKLLLAFVIVLLCCAACAQPDSSWVRYQGGFNFHEGIYLGFQSFRQNAPSIPKGKLSDDQGRAITNIHDAQSLFHPDTTGERKKIDLDRAWGFCENDVVYLRAGDGFYRIGQYGALCHLVFEQSVWTADPFYGGTYGGGRTTVQRQYVLDMETGAFQEFDAAVLGNVLARDEVLRSEWDALPKKKKRGEALYLFLRRYNERHPLYFPR